MAHGTRADLYAMYALIMREPPLDLGRFALAARKSRPHWYRVHWCQVCGSEHRERVYGQKPKDPEKRSSVTYCGCMDSQFA